MDSENKSELPEGVLPVLEMAEVKSCLGELVRWEILSGGLTNINYLLVGTDGKIVVRVGAKNAGLLSIDRANERANSIAAAEVGIGAPVIAHREAPSVLVIGYLEGKTLSKADLRSGLYLEGIAASLRRLHRARPFVAQFNMFATRDRYLQLVKERRYWLPKDYLAYEPAFLALRDALETHQEPLVPCNNDLLAENFIDSGGIIRIIDYEYSGNNEASFELGNIASESDLSEEQLRQLCASYWERDDEAKVARARLWAMAAKYGWTLWASLQDGAGELDFDFVDWGMEKFRRVVAEFESPEFKELLDRVRRS